MKINKIFAVLDERVQNGDMTFLEATERKEKIRLEIMARDSDLVEFEVDNNGSIEDSVIQIREYVKNGYRKT